jgi:hypothetical protein
MSWTERLTPTVPERPPSWTEIGLGVLIVSMLVSGPWSFDPVSWPAVVLGVLSIWIAAGPIATSSIGRQIEQRLQAVDFGTGMLVLGFVLGTILGIGILVLPPWLADGMGLGGLLGSLGWLCYHAVSAGEVSGWTAS